MLIKKNSATLSLAFLLSIGIVSESVFAVSNKDKLLLAQAPKTFSVPDKLPDGSTVKIASSESVDKVTSNLKSNFENKYSGTTVDLNTKDSDSALKQLSNKEIDLAAIGRPLTDKEKSQGFADVIINLEKTAIVVGENNSYNGNMTYEQFAKIFRGEITDWSQISGNSGTIRLVDFPDRNDTRTSLSRYKVFKTAPFKTDSNATKTSDSITSENFVRELGNYGISFAPVSKVQDLDGVKIVTMHKTLPDDPRYPYSQPQSLVYNSNSELSEATKAFLGFSQIKQNQQFISRSSSVPKVTTERETTTTTTTTKPNKFPWWLLWLLPIAGLLAWFLSRKKQDDDTATYSDRRSVTTTGTTGLDTRDREDLDTDNNIYSDRENSGNTYIPENESYKRSIDLSKFKKPQDTVGDINTRTNKLDIDFDPNELEDELPDLPNVGDRVKNTFGNLKDKASDTAQNLGNKMPDLPNVGDRAKNTFDNLKDRASDTAQNLGDRASQIKDNILEDEDNK